jgi:hypothetical protein
MAGDSTEDVAVVADMATGLSQSPEEALTV